MSLFRENQISAKLKYLIIELKLKIITNNQKLDLIALILYLINLILNFNSNTLNLNSPHEFKFNSREMRCHKIKLKQLIVIGSVKKHTDQVQLKRNGIQIDEGIELKFDTQK